MRFFCLFYEACNHCFVKELDFVIPLVIVAEPSANDKTRGGEPADPKGSAFFCLESYQLLQNNSLVEEFFDIFSLGHCVLKAQFNEFSTKAWLEQQIACRAGASALGIGTSDAQKQLERHW